MVVRSLSFTRRRKAKPTDESAVRARAEEREKDSSEGESSAEAEPDALDCESKDSRKQRGAARRARGRGKEEKEAAKEKRKDGKHEEEEDDDPTSNCVTESSQGKAKPSRFRKSPSFGSRRHSKTEPKRESSKRESSVENSDEEPDNSTDAHADDKDKSTRLSRVRRAASFGRRDKQKKAQTRPSQRGLWDDSDEEPQSGERQHEKGFIGLSSPFGRKENKHVGHSKDCDGEEDASSQRRRGRKERATTRDIWASDEEEDGAKPERNRSLKLFKIFI